MKTILLIAVIIFIFSNAFTKQSGNEIKTVGGHTPAGKYDREEYESYDKPNAFFSARDNERGSIELIWKYTTNVPQACNDEVKRRGLKTFHSDRTVACSFWSNGSCLIITNVKTTMHSVGHEVRHCFQGAWH